MGNGAWEELSSTGAPGPATVALLVSAIQMSGRSLGFPPPGGHRSWSEEAAFDLLGKLFVDKNDFLTALMVSADDETSLERLVKRTVRNWLIDEAKATVVGRMRRRLDSMLRKDSRFVSADHLLGGEDAWTISGAGDLVWGGDASELRARSERIPSDPLQALNSAGPASSANRAVLTDFVFSLLSLAGGAVRLQLIARCVVDRFALDEHPQEVAATDLSDGLWAVEDDVLVAEARDAILARLSARDEVLLALSDDLAAICRRFGVSEAVAMELLQDLYARVRPVITRTDIGKRGLQSAIDECSKRM